MNWKDLKIGTKIMGGFFAVAIIALIIGIIGYSGINKVAHSFHEVSDVRMPSVESLKDIEFGLEKLRVAQRTLLNPNLSDEDKARQFKNIADAREHYGKAIAKYEPLPQTEEEAKLWDEFRVALAEWRKSNDEFEKLMDEITKTDIFYPMQFLKDLEKFEGDHYSLQVQIVDAIRSGRVFDGGEDHTLCNLGKWLPKLETQNAAVNNAFNNLKEPHRQFHESVHQIKALLRQGNFNAAWNLYENQMQPSAEKVFEYFAIVISESEKAVGLFEQAEKQVIQIARQDQETSLDLLDKIVTLNEELAQTELDNGDRAVTTSDTMLLAGIIIGLVLAILLGIIITRMISVPLRKGVVFAKDIADGNLMVSLDAEITNRKDEVGQLGAAMQQMSDKLKDIVMNIIVGADNIASASQQMSSTSQQMSQGANEQASSAEEVSSSMEEMVSNIQQNTDNAQSTEKIAINATDGINQGNESTKVSVESMKQIAEKITIINDIAFQTNILALNAAVEAARAGEHGKGFAVVAAEVRKLAERSKVAADEIDQLSKSGVAISEKAGQQLAEIVPEIEKTAKLVQEIAAASIEQNSGADQVNNAIQQLNQVTQQNAAASEEMATGAEELSSQAQQLKDMISFFKVDNQSNQRQLSYSAPVKNKKTTTKTAAKPIKEKGAEIKLDTYDSKDDEYEKF